MKLGPLRIGMEPGAISATTGAVALQSSAQARLVTAIGYVIITDATVATRYFYVRGLLNNLEVVIMHDANGQAASLTLTHWLVSHISNSAQGDFRVTAIKPFIVPASVSLQVRNLTGAVAGDTISLIRVLYQEILQW